MIQAQSGQPFQAILENAPPNQAGVFGFTIYDTTNAIVTARTIAGINEIPAAGAGDYAIEATAPTVAGTTNFRVIWDNGSGRTIGIEELVVTTFVPPLTPAPAGASPTNGPCAPWIDETDLAAQPYIMQAIAKLNASVTPLDPGQIATILTDSAAGASEVLYEMSGRIFTGGCGPVTVRPVSRPADVDSWGARAGWVSSWGICSWGWSTGGQVSHFGCSNPPQVDLGAYPVIGVSQVLIDGVVIPPDEYRLDDFKMLTRIRPTISANPTERWGWPTCQDLSLPDTEIGTFSVTYTFGQAPPRLGIIACRKMAEMLALPQLGDTSKYPQRLTSITRQGVSAMAADIIDVMGKSGSSGIYEVDTFIKSVNPQRLQRQARVWSPDIGRARRMPSS